MVELMNEADFWDEDNLTLNDYQNSAMETAIYPDELIYPLLGLQSECGELSSKLKKHFRDNEYEVTIEDAIAELPATLRLDMAHEAADCLWYIAAIASDLGYSLQEIAELNLEKLDDRKRRNTLKGDGDYR